MSTDARPAIDCAAHPRGAITVEFALTALVFFTFVFGAIELARMMYLWNTLPEVTRRAARAAALADFSSSAALSAIRQDALFNPAAGQLVLGGGIDPSYVRIDYLSLTAGGALQPVTAMPACPTRNVINCLNDPNGASCIRFVRVRICLPTNNDCDAVPYAPMLGLLSGAIPDGALNVPPSTTLVPAESLGYRSGMPDCP